MKRSKFSEEQVVYALRQAEGGTPVGDLCRQLGVSDATFYAWKKKYAHLGVSELRRLRQLEEENNRLKRLVATSRSTSTCCRRRCEKKSEARPPPRARPVVSGDVSGAVRAGLPIGAIQSGSLVSTEPTQGSHGVADTDSRSRSRATWVWVSADLGVAASRRLAGESETSTPVVPARRIAAAHAGPAAKTYSPASRTRSHASRTDRAMEYGFCA